MFSSQGPTSSRCKELDRILCFHLYDRLYQETETCMKAVCDHFKSRQKLSFIEGNKPRFRL